MSNLGKYADGRPLNHEGGTFDIGGTAVTLSQVLGWDQTG